MENLISPPAELVARVGGELSDPKAFLGTFKRRGRLKPDEDVLYVGCGVGRAAIPLTTYLKGRYEGFDVDAELIGWCQQNITQPNFHFTHVQVYNGFYVQQGVPASEFTFPYPDGSFDLAFGFSLFTHLLPIGLERYLSEIRRVLRSQGRLFFTFFLLNPKTREILAKGGPLADALRARDQGDYSTGYEVPEALVAYRQGYVRDLYERMGFELEEIRRGDWPLWAIGRQADYIQDFVFASLP